MEKDVEKLIEKVKKFTKEKKIDLSSEEDLSIAVMNLISIEEHLYFTAAKTKKRKYFDLLQEVREVRKGLLKKLIKNYEGETWCISKHLLAATMRLIEVGTKEFNKDNKKEAEKLFSKAHQLYSFFWGINLKLVNIDEVKKIGENQLNVHDKEKGTLTSKLSKVIRKIIDCCKE
jgi:predicted S18 family serine protease